MSGVTLTIIGSMIVVNAVLAAYEIALASVSLGRLHILRNERRWGAAAASAMKESMESSLAVVQLGITLVGAIAAATGGAGAEEALAPWLGQTLGVSSSTARFLAVAIVVLPLTFVTITAGELVPKVFALKHKEWVCLRLSPLLYWLSYALWPAVWALETSANLLMKLGERIFFSKTKERRGESVHVQELHAMATMAKTLRIIGAREEQIIINAARLSSRKVREILLPARDINMMMVEDSMSQCLITAHLDMHTRFPVTEEAGDPNRIIGYVNFKDIVAQLRLAPDNPSLRSVLRPLMSIREDVTIAHGLEQMIMAHQHISLVRDLNGRVMGMITLEDILEELVGEIEDEHDRLPAHISASEAGLVAGGAASIKRISDLLGIDLNADFEIPQPLTLSDWMARRLGREAHGGDEVRWRNVRVLVRKLRRDKVQEAQITLDKTPLPPVIAEQS